MSIVIINDHLVVCINEDLAKFCAFALITNVTRGLFNLNENEGFWKLVKLVMFNTTDINQVNGTRAKVTFGYGRDEMRCASTTAPITLITKIVAGGVHINPHFKGCRIINL